MERLSCVACFGALERGRPRCRAVASTSVVFQSNPTTRNPLHTARETGAFWSHPVLIAALEGKDYQSQVLCVVFFCFSLVAQELLRDVLNRARSYYTLDWWAVTRRPHPHPTPPVLTFFALSMLYLSVVMKYAASKLWLCWSQWHHRCLAFFSFSPLLLTSAFLYLVLLNVKMLTHSWS